MTSPIPAVTAPTPPSAPTNIAISTTATTTAATSTAGASSSSSSPTIIDLDSIPGQIGHAIVRIADGTILRPPTGSLSNQDVEIVYRMMLEIGTVLEGGTGGKDTMNNISDSDEVVVEGLQRVTVGFKEVSYAITLGGSDGCLYIVKKKSSL
ncbi:hypothetical protein ACHAWC_008447 [Mediolabrus comicus]